MVFIVFILYFGTIKRLVVVVVVALASEQSTLGIGKPTFDFKF